MKEAIIVNGNDNVSADQVEMTNTINIVTNLIGDDFDDLG